MLTHFSLFTGIGGIDLAAEWAGFETVGQCEWADYPTKVLKKHWPDVPRWRDVKDVTAKSIRKKGITDITLLSGGFPCQPHSVAGERKGSADERDLWGEFARVICETKPRWVLGENVPGLYTTEDGRFFGRILNDLAKMGYSVGWCCYGANRVGAIHRRERVFIIAYDSIIGIQRIWKEEIQRIEAIPGGENVRGHKDFRTRSYIHTPKLCRSYNGIPDGVDRLKCLGNAVVPQQVYPILQAIADVEGAINN